MVTRTTRADDWLPDFCSPPILFSTLVGAQLVVIVMGLTPGAEIGWTLREWLAGSALAQWLALCSAVVLCKLRPALQRLPRMLGGTLAWLLPVGVAFVGSLLLLWLSFAMELDIGSNVSHPLLFAAAIAALAALLSATLLRYFHFQQRWQQQVAAQARAQVDALQARIRPHFLFNSMNSIASLVRRDPVTAERAIEDLADLFRAALGADGADASLAEEIELCQRFLAIESLRLGSRLEVTWALEDGLPEALRLPKLLLQPLMENAIVHGIAELQQGGRLSIEMRRDTRQLVITIGNPYPPGSHVRSGNRHAQSSVAQRLAYAFGERAKMTVSAGEGYYSCELRIPLDD